MLSTALLGHVEDGAEVVLDSGLTLHYQQVGDGPDVVMVHGTHRQPGRLAPADRARAVRPLPR